MSTFNFTGSSRRPKNINLSGKKTTTQPAFTSSSTFNRRPATISAIQAAKEERAAREAEKRRGKAACSIQRVWRGRFIAEGCRTEWRKLFDQEASGRGNTLDEVSLLLAIRSWGGTKRRKQWDGQDLVRLLVTVKSLQEWITTKDAKLDDARARYLLTTFSTLLIEALSLDTVNENTLDVLDLLPLLSQVLPEISDDRYYTALSRVTSKVDGASKEKLLDALIVPLLPINQTEQVLATTYGSFAVSYLTTPELWSELGESSFMKLKNSVDPGRLLSLLVTSKRRWERCEVEERMWLLSHIIFFCRGILSADHEVTATPQKSDELEKDYVMLLSLLLSSLAAEIQQRIEISDEPMQDQDDEDEKGNHGTPLPAFIRQQVQSLLKKSIVSSLIAKVHSSERNAQVLAGFAETLLFVFPARRDDIRMWLVLAETSDKVSSVKFFWNQVKECAVFNKISEDSKDAVEMLLNASTSDLARATERDWNAIILFLEVYGFLMNVTDDAEFFTGDDETGKGRQLSLSDVKDLSVFLKNLAFTMYWFHSELIGQDARKSADGRGWTLKDLRETATSVIKKIYARDSRRAFLPKDHWLMTDRFNMEGFIPAVVAEEEKRHEAEDSSDAEEEREDDAIDPETLTAMNPHQRRLLQISRMQKARSKRQKQHNLTNIAPRLLILQNLPFFIPFATRVQIFRGFVLVDQSRRRDGAVDPDAWRARSFHIESQGKHHASIRRTHEFEDAYKQFWTLGEGLKEPIQITFVDRFGSNEAGIDGGGVTKEFLTGVCSDAFTPLPHDTDNMDDAGEPSQSAMEEEDDDNLLPAFRSLFKENSQNLLYPNPTAIDELKTQLEDYALTTSETFQQVKELLNRFEFLGRTVGKCLYEGILVDINFAPFFLLKWSQPTSLGSSVGGVNDLRDLDEGLYRGLLMLKNYKGDVERDLSTYFAVDFQIPDTSPPRVKTIPLKPNGEDIPVTNENRLEYIHKVSHFHLTARPYQQTSAFLRGLSTIIKPQWLSMFNQGELQTLVGGDTNSSIDIEDLRKNTIYGGVYMIGDDGEEHETIKLFWQVMHELSDEERRKVLQFVTSVSRPPLLGFGVLKPKFSIRDAGRDRTRLCSASTCVNLLKMPQYQDKETLRQKLLYSVSSKAGFDLS